MMVEVETDVDAIADRENSGWYRASGQARKRG